MKINFKRAMSWLLVLTMLLSMAAAMTVNTSAIETYLGRAGNGINAYYDAATKTLRLTGSGAMYDFIESGKVNLVNNRQDTPWHNAGLTDEIRKVVVGYGITTIGNAAFYHLTQCAEYDLPQSLRSIGEWAFGRNTALKSITIPSSVQNIYSFAFFNTGLRVDGIRNSVCYGSPVIENKHVTGTTVNGDLINDLDDASLNRVVIQAEGSLEGGITWYYSSANKTLTLEYKGAGTASMPNLTSGRPWDNYMSDIEKLVVGAKILNIGASSMVGAGKLSSVTLGADVQSIDAKAFAGCVSLTRVSLPAATKSIAAEAFSSRSSSSNTVLLITPNTQEVMTPGFTTTGNELVRWSYGSATGGSTTPPATTTNSGTIDGGRIKWEYTSSNGYLTLSLVTGYTTGVIPNYTSAQESPWAQAGLNDDITRVIVAAGITRVGDYAFANLDRSVTIALGNSVQTVGEYAFTNNYSLGLVTFPASVQLVEPNAFTNCVNLWYAEKYNANMVVATPNVELLAALSRASGTVTPPSGGDTGGGSTDPNPNPGTGSGTGNDISGTISGTTLTWSYNTSTRAFNIRGEGAIPDYTSTSPAPWAAYVSDITAITVHTGITAIGANAFAGVINVVDIYIPDSVKSIGSQAFYGCTKLQTISLPQGLSSMGAGAFRECTALTSVSIPTSMTEIPEYAFYNCASLESVKLPEGLSRIGRWAFYGCKKLGHLDFPATLTSIGSEAFYGNTGLTGVVLRSPAMTIGANAFSGCTGIVKAVYVLTKPTAEAGNEPLTSKYVERNGTGSDGALSWTVDRADGTLIISGTGAVTSKSAWESELPFVHTVIFNEGITGIGANLLKGCDGIKTVVLSNTIKSIGNSAFEQCTSLENVTLPNALEALGARAFYGCSSLKSVDLPDTLRQIADGTFGFCSSLSTVGMSDALVLIGEDAFLNCTALANLIIPFTVTTISPDAFGYCTSLESLTLFGDNLLPLTTGRFDNCSNLKTVYFNGSATEWSTLTLNADDEIKRATVVYCVTLTVNYVYKEGPMAGQQAATSEVFSGQAGNYVTVTPPSVAYHTPSTPQVSFLLPYKDSTQTIEYSPNKYTLTVLFVDADTLANVDDPRTYQLSYYDTLTKDVGTLVGYTPLTDTVEIKAGEMVGDKTITILCTKKQYTYTVEYVNDRTGNVIKTEEKTAAHGSSPSMLAPALEGYTPKEASGVYSLNNVTADGGKITIPYTPNLSKLTIHYVDEEGNKLTNDYAVDHYYGDKISVASPEITGMTPDIATVTLDEYHGESEMTVTYEWKYYTVTIHFTENNSYNWSMHEDYTATVKHGDKFTFTLVGNVAYPTPAEYEASKQTIEYTSVTQDIEETILYTPKEFALTIRYVDKAGNLLESLTVNVRAADTYTVPEKEIVGYLKADEIVVSMGPEDKTIDVEMEQDPDYHTEEPKSGAGKVVVVILIIVLILGGGGALFYFLYMRRS